MVEVDVTTLERKRALEKERLEAVGGPHLTLLPYFIQAVCDALGDFPLFNSRPHRSLLPVSVQSSGTDSYGPFLARPARPFTRRADRSADSARCQRGAAVALQLLRGRKPVGLPGRAGFHGQDDDTADEMDHERLHTVTLPPTSRKIGQTLESLALHAVGVRIVNLRRVDGQVSTLDVATLLQAHDVLVINGKPQALALAEEKLLRG